MTICFRCKVSEVGIAAPQSLRLLHHFANGLNDPCLLRCGFRYLPVRLSCKEPHHAQRRENNATSHGAGSYVRTLAAPWGSIVRIEDGRAVVS